MTTTSCPNCGKPLRPGARFCGNCGATIPATPAAQAGKPPAGAATIPCPQCGKPVRVGAKFCSNCGKVLQPEPAPLATSSPPAPPASSPSPAAQPQPVAAPAAGQPAESPSARAAVPPQNKAGAGRKMMWPLIILLLVVICVLGGSGTYLYLKDPFGWFAAATASPIAAVPSQTPGLAATATGTKVALSTENPPTPTITAPVGPAVTETLTVTVQVSPTILLTPVIPVSGIPVTGTLLTSTIPLTAPAILLNDYFNGPLNVNWKAWGNPRPILRSGPGDNWLDLTATEHPEMAGVTTRMEIANAPGNVFEFEGQLNPNYVNFPLFFDWDPLQYDRGPENPNPGVLHLAIQNKQIVLQASAANNNCQKEFEGAKQHRYILKFVGDKQLALYIDGSDQPICQLDLGIKAIPGRISFSGTGWVSHILVTGSSLP